MPKSMTEQEYRRRMVIALEGIKGTLDEIRDALETQRMSNP